MAKNSIGTSISTQVVKFKPGGPPVTFKVTVTNNSDRFATFLVDLTAAGSEVENAGWYSLSPEVSSKKPPGDSTEFFVIITDPPIPGFLGTINLTLRVFSLELADEERQVIRLVIEEGSLEYALKMELPTREFYSSPRNLIEIPVRIHNPGYLLANVHLTFSGVERSWMVDGAERRFQLIPNGDVETIFLCQLPDTTLAPSQVYDFKIDAEWNNGLPSKVAGTIEVAFEGFMDFRCSPAKRNIPHNAFNFLTLWKSKSTTYNLEFENFSNSSQQISGTVEGEDLRRLKYQITPETAEVKSGEKLELQLVVTAKRRRWLGIGNRRLVFVAKAIVEDQNLDVRNDTQMLQLFLVPVIHPLIQLIIILLLIFWAWDNSYLNPNNPNYGHQAAVNSVQFNGMADEAVSGSDDQFTLRWLTDGFLNPIINQNLGILGKANKAVRVVRYRPIDNTIVAAGLENGEIQLWNLLTPSKKPLETLSYQKDDRVLALEFSKDPRYLFSGHGSGLLLQWNSNPKLSENDGGASEHTSSSHRLIRQKKLDFAIYGLAVVGEESNHLAIGGRFNQLVVWDWMTDKLTNLSYPHLGGQEDYITSLNVPKFLPNRLAVADNQGYITLWNMKKCLDSDVECEILDQWNNGHDGKPVRSVAYNATGCYLASAGDDGQVKIWPLTKEGKRSDKFPIGKTLGHSQKNKKINSVDIRVVGQQILVVYASDDTQVSLFTSERLYQAGCDQPE